ncbi:Major facilitator superfamily [Macrophomina phaseolina MS6]|uniref:Major facilitator superfamily n=1 Tax=Macrophomina phaseolina (strain MS6) TaxID=1126212 RepID=K2QVC4_MACPH|nr:Major facilitator superfamily [Macrophomina phaseolina MS6]
MSQLIVSHLVSVRERSKFLAIIFAMFGVGASVGPVLGGVLVQRASWRWAFWLNLPIGGITLGLLYFFLHGTAAAGRLPLLEKLKTIDWAGNALLTGSCVPLLLALSWARTRYPWSSWKVILPAVVGLVGQAGFCVFEGSKYCKHPMMPPRVFANRTSGAAMAFTFFQTMLQGSRIYFLPVYFQGVRLASPETSGLLMLPSVVAGPPSAVIAGYAVTRCGRYKPIHLAGLGLAAVGAGLFMRLVRSTTMVEVVMSQIVISCGAGMLPNTVLPAIQASLPQADLVACTSAFSFLRSYGNVWALPISSFIFSSWFSAHANEIDVYANVSPGSAYAHASARFIKSLPGDVGSQLITLYADSLRLLWDVSLGISIACFLAALLEREVPMATTAMSETRLTDSRTPPRPPETR